MAGLEGHRILITGASSGIGAEAAGQLAAEGARVALLARSRPGLEKVAARITEAGGSPVVVVADVTDREALAAAVDEAVTELGGLDVVVSAVGATAYGEFTKTPAADFDRTVEVTLIGNVNTVREALPHLERSRGTIVVVGSASDRVPLPLQSAYTASKAALRAFMETLGAELRAARVPVKLSLIRPGPVDTPFWTHGTNPEDLAPPSPTLVYSPETVGRAIVATARNPRPMVTVGAAMAGLQLLTAAGPLTRLGYTLATRGALAISRTRDDVVRALWEPSGAGEVRESGRNRRSLWVDLRVALRI